MGWLFEKGLFFYLSGRVLPAGLRVEIGGRGCRKVVRVEIGGRGGIGIRTRLRA